MLQCADFFIAIRESGRLQAGYVQDVSTSSSKKTRAETDPLKFIYGSMAYILGCGDMWAVKMRIFSPYGERESIVMTFRTKEEALRAARELREGALSNPRSRATFYVEFLP